MKTKLFLIAVTFVALALVLAVGQPLPDGIVAEGVTVTNAAPATPSAPIPETFKPLLELLAGKGTIVTTLLAWTAALSVLLSPFAVWIRNKLADAMNAAAASSSLDDDVYLTRLFSNKVYRFTAFLLNFANVRLPTLTELERAIELQKEAKATEAAIKGPTVT
jgi:hypothetical protein